jgi:hypothetical protein
MEPARGCAGWARFQNGKIGAKVHVVFDPTGGVPIFFEVSSGNVEPAFRPASWPDRGDLTVAKSSMPVERGATHVFDLGYYDYGSRRGLLTAGPADMDRWLAAIGGPTSTGRAVGSSPG